MILYYFSYCEMKYAFASSCLDYCSSLYYITAAQLPIKVTYYSYHVSFMFCAKCFYYKALTSHFCFEKCHINESTYIITMTKINERVWGSLIID